MLNKEGKEREEKYQRNKMGRERERWLQACMGRGWEAKARNRQDLSTDLGKWSNVSVEIFKQKIRERY